MSSKSMSFKAKINNYAKVNHLPAQVVLQNVMFERFLDRLSKSEYRDKFVIKGGILVSALVGLDTRATMDLDTTLRKLTLTEEKVREAVEKICVVDLSDDISFRINSVAPIRRDDVYGGFRVKIEALYEDIVTPLSIDVSTGDVITPEAVEYEIGGIMDDTVRIKVWGYNIETALAEKVETILSRDVLNTRPRDYYDVYILTKEQEYDPAIFKDALRATAEHRGTWERIENWEPILDRLVDNDDLRNLWEKYRREFYYARNITFEETIEAARKLLK